MTINDPAEQSWVHATALDVTLYTSWWIGYNDRGASSSEEPDEAWEWSDGSSSTWENFGGGQPDDWWGEDCGMMWISGGAWNDGDCWDYMYFICEASFE